MWTESQEEAINTLNGNVLISASAGSGKTGVMIARTTKIILEGRAGVDRILAVTFTKKSAEELRERLSAQLKKNSDKREMAEQLEKLPSADICTIHSFCSKLLKTYSYQVDLPPDFAVMEEHDAEELKAEVIDHVIGALYESEDKDFKYFAEKYFINRKDAFIREKILGIYNFIMSEADPVGYLNKSLAVYTKENYIDIVDSLLKRYVQEIEKYLAVFDDCRTKRSEKWNKYAEISQELYENAYKLIRCLTPSDSGAFKSEYLYDKIDFCTCRLILNAGFSVLRGPNLEDEENVVKEWLKTNKALYAATCKEISGIIDMITLQQDGFFESGKDLAILINITKNFMELYGREKLDRGQLDFNDLEQYTVKLLKDDEIANALKEKYLYIMVDEYQDVNSAQEYIIERISNDNLFLVGDVKQAIYGFRGSDSEIFLSTAQRFNGGQGKCIEFNENFRSSKAVIDGVNDVFSVIMTKENSGVDYKSSPMKCSREDVADGECVVYKCAKFERERERAKDEVYDLVADATSEKYTQENEQINGICSLIQSQIGQPYYNAKTQSFEPITYKDVAVLLRTADDDFIKSLMGAFTKCNIPFGKDEKACIPDYPEINGIIETLRLIYDKNDISLTSALKSSVGKFTDKELCEIRQSAKDDKCSFAYAVENYQGEALKEKILNFFKYIEELTYKATIESAGSVISDICTQTGLEYVLGVEPDGKEKLKRVRRLIKIADKMSVDELLSKWDNGVLKINEASLGNDTCVKIMTMHASKGLEFPVVILANCSKRFNTQDFRKRIYFDRKLGIAFDWYNEKDRNIYKTPFGKYISLKIGDVLEEEEKRLLYVAMTRAKNKLFIFETESENEKTKVNSFADFINKGALSQGDARQLETELKREPLHVIIKEEDAEFAQKLKKVYAYKYPYSESPLKRSVTAVAKETALEEELNYDHYFGKTDAEKGTAYHRFLELWDFKEDYALLYERLKSTEDEKTVVENTEPSVLEKICQMPVFSALKGYTLYREKNFFVNVNSSWLYGAGDDDVLVQGAIDLLAIKGEEAIIVDYKYSALTDEDLVKRYKRQLELYVYAVEKILHKKARAIIVNIYSQRQIEL